MEPKTDPEEESDEAQIFIVRRGCKTVGLLQTEEIIVSLSLFSAELPDVLEKVWLICRNTLDRDPHHGLSTLRSRGSQPFDLPGKQLQVLSINEFLITPEWNQNCSLLSNGACSANVDSI